MPARSKNSAPTKSNGPATPAVAPTLESGDSFTDVTFSDLAIEGADLSDKEFERCTFRNCKLPESRWGKSRLEDCVFEGCELSRMVPDKLALRAVTFRDTRLWGVDWSQVANFPNFEFDKCDLRYSSFVKLPLKRAHFVDCRLDEVSFIDVDLTEADFSGAKLLGSNIEGCILVKTNFARAVDVLFDPSKNRVKDARIGVDTAIALVRALGCVVE